MDGAREINELHVPIGPPGEADHGIRGRHPQLLHPDFRVKADVIPGRYNTMWFTATKPGSYHIFCTQYCGTKHSAMIGWVTVMEPADYQAWLARRPAGRHDGRERRPSCSPISRATPATSTRAQGRGPSLRKASTASQVLLQRPDGGGRRRLHARVDPQPAGEDRRRASSRSCRPSRGWSPKSSSCS